MTSRSGWLVTLLTATAIAGWAGAVAGPGSGTALITPSAPVSAGSAGEWSVQYTAAEAMQDGRIRITIPSGWTAPQSGSSSSAGYVTVSTDEPTGAPQIVSVAGQVVSIDVDTLSVGNIVTLVYGDDSGSASGRAVAETAIGSYTFLVASDPTGTSPDPLVTSPSLTVVAAAPSYLEIAPSDTSVTAGTFAEYRLIVRDEFGNRAPVASGRTVNLFPGHGAFYLPSNHGAPISNVLIASGKTSARIDYRGTLATAPGSPHTLFVTTVSGSPQLAGTDQVSIVPAGLSTTQSTVTATTPKIANGTDQSSVTVTSKDAFSNLREGDEVALDVTGSAVDVDPNDTDENGEAVGVVTDIVAETVTVSATINGQSITDTAPITFTAGPVNAGTSLVDATTPVIANGTSSSTITVTAKDANGNPVAGQNVTLSIAPPGAGAVLTQPGFVTNSLGVATGTLTSPTVGPRTVSAQIGATPITDNAVVNFTAGAVASFEWAIVGGAVAGTAKAVVLTAKDAQGHVVTDYTGTVNLGTNSTGVGNGVVEWSDVDAQGTIVNGTDDNATYAFDPADNGVAALRITDTKAETIILSASGPAAGNSSPLVVSPGAPDEVQLVAGDGQSATVNTPVATPPKVKVVDAFGNAVTGATVTFTVTAGGGTRDVVAGGGADATGLTASDGTLDCDVWRVGTDTDTNPNQLSASIASGTTPSVTFTATATAGPGNALVLTPGSKGVTVGSNEQVMATLIDSFGNAKSGEMVTVVIKSGSHGRLEEDTTYPGTTTELNEDTRQGLTDATGRITVQYHAPVTAGLVDVLDASTPNVAQGAVADVSYTSDASGATNLRITFVGASTQPAGGIAQFTIEAVDGNGNRDLGNSSLVTFTPESGSGLVFSDQGDMTPVITQTTLSAGVDQIWVRGITAGVWDITATTGGAIGQDIAILTVTDTGVIDHYSVSTVPSVAAGVSFDVSVLARDQYDNLVDGANNSITLTAIDDVTTGTVTPNLVVTVGSLSGGQATVGTSYTKADAIRVRVTDAGAKQGISGVLTVTAAVAKRITKVSGDGTGFAAGSNRNLTVRVLDQYDNPVSSQQVTFQVLQGGGSALPLIVSTGGTGDATTVLTTGAVAGDNRVRASIDNGVPAIDEQVEFSVVTVAGAIDHFTVVPQKTSLIAGEVVPITITAYDSGDNVVSSDNTTQVQLSSSGNAQFGDPTGTLTAGVYATTVTDTLVQNFTVTAQKQGGGPPSGTSASISVANAGAYRVVKSTGDGSGITAGTTRVLNAIVRDQYSNVVPNALVTFAVLSAPDGTGSFTDTSGDPNDGIAVANGSGVATVTYTTAQTAGANQVNAQILDGAPANLEKVTFTVNTIAGGIAYYGVQMNATSTTAGVSKTVTVTAYDDNDNVVDDDVTQVALTGDPGNGLAFGSNPITLINGVRSTSVTANLVQTYRVRASTVGNGAITGLGPQVDVVPAAPAGTITATATDNPITANGTSTTTITSSVIRDAFTNQVAQGLTVNVSANNGGVIVGGGARTIGADGRIVFNLQSSTTPGPSTVTMTSEAPGTATGNIVITFAQKPALAANNPPTPAIVVPGQSVAFSVQVNNTAPNLVDLTTATTFTFTDGTRIYTSTLAAPQTIPASGNVVLAFSSATVNAAFTTASYSPSLNLIGTDQYSAPVNVTVSLPAASLLVTSIEMTSIVPEFGVVSRGQTFDVAVTVKNNGAQPTVINDVDLNFNPSGLFNVGNAPELGQSINAGASKVFNVPVTVQVGAAIQSYQIDAVATGTVGGQPVTDNAIAPYPTANVQVTAAANLAYENGTLSPTTVSSGDSYAFQVTIRNNGGGLVLLNPAQTNITFTDGVRTYSAQPVQSYAIAGGGATQLINFSTSSVNASFTPGSYPATFNAGGTENGSPFSQAVPLTSVTVQSPATVTADGEVLNPEQVTKTTTAAFTVDVQNTGGATVLLTPGATTIRFSGTQYLAALNATGPTTLPPGTTTLQFLGATVSNAIPPGNYFPTVQLTGTENGNPFSLPIVLDDDVVVQGAPSIAILNMQSSQAQFTADQGKAIKVRMIVSNSNGADVTFTAASMRFIHAGIDRSSQFVISTPSTFQRGSLLTSGETDTVLFNVSDNAGPMSVGNMTIEGDLEVEEVNTGDPVFADTDLGGKGNLMVMTPAAITFDAVIPSQTVVTQSMGRDIKVRAVVRNTGGSEVVLALANPATHLNFSPPSGWVVTSPATLAGGGSTLTGGELDTLIFNVTTSGSTPGPATVSVTTSGIETNSGDAVNQTSSPANILVQSPGAIQVVSVVPSQPSVTENTPLPWTITVTLTNPGDSDVNLALGGNVGLTIQDQGTPPSFTIASTLAGGGTLLSGGETDQLVISLTSTGSYTSRGAKDITVDIDGTEVNSGAPKSVVNSTGSVLVQQAPDPAFVSLDPGTVSRLTSVAFAVDVTNPAMSNRATMTLDRNLSRLRFGSGQYNVGLALASPVTIASGGQETLQFAGATIGLGVPLGLQSDAELELHWTHNGITSSEIIPISTFITVEDAPALSILSVRPSNTTLTRQQSPAGTVTMVVRNSGGAAVNLNLGAATTRLGFKVLSSGAIVTGEYTVQQPSALEFAGSTVLAGGATDSLVFNLTLAGVTPGSIIVNGYVGGIDLNSSQPVSDDTFDGGSGSLELQLPGALSILSLTPSQSTATAGQTTKSYTVKMAVRNTGGAAIDVSLPQASSDIQFVGKSGFVHSDAAMPNGVTLFGGETDTLRFTVTTTGSPAGLTTIAGNVSGVENNTGLTRTDDTTSGGTGSILLQTQATLIVDSVTPSQASITELTSAPWSTTIALHNAGESAARLNLPAGFSVSVQSGTTSFVAPADLEEGGVILAGGASGTLVSTTPTTGDFTVLGSRAINVTVGATELNSNRALAPQGAGAVIVQTQPNLVVTAVRPPIVTSASVVDFEVDVQNPGATAATARLNRGATRVHFASQAFSAFLDVTSADSIEAGETVTLRFEAKIIPASIPVGPYTFNVNLDYTHNGIARSELETNNVSVQAAPQLAITQIVTSQPSVTASQTTPWTATMTVMNNGAADIDLDLLPAKTGLTFIGPGGSQDGNYIVTPGVVAAGEDTLSTSEVANIVFTITTTGTQTGNIVISGRVEGRDLNQLSIVTDDTFSGGRGGISVQSASSVAITAVHATQPKVTVGQAAWSVRVLLANTGGADVNVNLGLSALTMAGGTTFGSPTLFGGGNTLEGGTVDSLLFQVVATGSAGVHAINASVPWNEVNSSASGTAVTNPSNDGQITVQTQPNLQITTTTSQSPNAGEVNTNQAFNVVVQVQNTGQADANDVLLNMTRDGSSVIAPIVAIPAVAGGQTVSYPLGVTAAAAPNPNETFITSLVSAHDANSGRTDLITTQSPLDATAQVAVQNPAVLDILSVRPSQTTVTRGQANPWNVIVRLRNTGQSDAVLTTPAAGDIDFSLAGATKIDYVVQPPAQFGSGAAGWTLPGLATDSLIYRIVTTGNDPGTVDIAAAAAGTDRNDPTQPVSDTGAGTVMVQDLAGVFIQSTVPVGTFNHVTADRDVVNTDFDYEIHVTVQNSGGEGVDSVLVNVTNDGQSTVDRTSDIKRSIAAGGSYEFVFRIRSASGTDALETFQAGLLAGIKSANSGQTVIPQPPIDRLHQTVIQLPANLTTNLFVASPPGSAGGVVGVSQVFTLGARVSNPTAPAPGRAAVSGPAEVTLTVPVNFTVQENLIQTFAPNDTVTWTVTAPPAIQSAQNFTCAITTTPTDVNSGAPALASVPSDVQSITVSSGGALVSPNLVAISPPGAGDDTLSVLQDFTVRASVTTSRIRSLVSTLTLPPGFTVLNGGLVRNLGNAAGSRQVDYDLRAPGFAASLDDLFVTFTAVDTITGGPVPSAADTMRVLVVPRTTLAVSAGVTAPPEAMDNTVGIGTSFTITATVTNAAGAADIEAPGSLQITLPGLYSLAAGHTAQKPFVVGSPVSWLVNAAAQPSGPDQIGVSIVIVPNDENSNEAAQVSVGAVNIAMVTEGAAVSVRNVSQAQSVGSGVAPGGAKDLDVLAFEIAYNVTDTSVGAAEVDTIALTIIGADGRPLGPTVVSQTLARLAIDLGGPQPYEVVNPNTNPVLVSLEGGGTDREIAPDGSIDAVVYLDLDAAPRATELRVRVTDMIVDDPGSTEPLGVTDPLGQPLDGQITSGPLVVLSSNFEEYAHNAPNPFRAGSSQTMISYFMNTPSTVDIRIFDITGELVYEESIPSGDARAQPGPQESPWDGRNMKGDVVRNGIYVCVLNAGGQSAKFRIAVAK